MLRDVTLCYRVPMFDEATRERFWQKVDIGGDGDCWMWQASLRNGYGQFGVSKSHHVSAHRYAYEDLVGVIPSGMVVDHLCHTRDCRLGELCPHRRCCNPSHMEVVSRGENVLRGNGDAAVRSRWTHCIRGHEFNEGNTYVDANGYRHCRRCGADRAREKWRALHWG